MQYLVLLLLWLADEEGVQRRPGPNLICRDSYLNVNLIISSWGISCHYLVNCLKVWDDNCSSSFSRSNKVVSLLVLSNDESETVLGLQQHWSGPVQKIFLRGRVRSKNIAQSFQLSTDSALANLVSTMTVCSIYEQPVALIVSVSPRQWYKHQQVLVK